VGHIDKPEVLYASKRMGSQEYRHWGGQVQKHSFSLERDSKVLTRQHRSARWLFPREPSFWGSRKGSSKGRKRLRRRGATSYSGGSLRLGRGHGGNFLEGESKFLQRGSYKPTRITMDAILDQKRVYLSELHCERYPYGALLEGRVYNWKGQNLYNGDRSSV